MIYDKQESPPHAIELTPREATVLGTNQRPGVYLVLLTFKDNKYQPRMLRCTRAEALEYKARAFTDAEDIDIWTIDIFVELPE